MSKLELQDFVKYGELFEVYGKLLTGDRQKIMTYYFQFNMTLVEIANERQISRQAVLDAIAKSCKKLDEFEAKLMICQSKTQLFCDLKSLRSFAKDKEIQEKVDDIIRKI